MSQNVVKSAARALQVLEVFEKRAQAMNLSEIVDAMSIPQSSASVLLKTLVELGFVNFDSETRLYSPSVRVAMLGTWVLGGPTVTGDVLAVVKRVHEETGQTVALAVQNALMLQYVNVVESTEALRFIVNPGVSRPIHLASLGIVLLSLKSDEEISRMMRHWNARNTDPTLAADINKVLAMVQQVRDNGYIRTDGLYTPNAGVLAVPFVVGDDIRPLALGVGGYTEIFRGQEEAFFSSLTNAINEFNNGGKKPRH